ncbi:hypothetical protein AHF37_04923 [Paragonimus kellicotti]|nr:hypothetical protein AHF37_04923 [Paragonimus kellicotti]
MLDSARHSARRMHTAKQLCDRTMPNSQLKLQAFECRTCVEIGRMIAVPSEEEMGVPKPAIVAVGILISEFPLSEASLVNSPKPFTTVNCRPASEPEETVARPAEFVVSMVGVRRTVEPTALAAEVMTLDTEDSSNKVDSNLLI